MAQTDPPAAAGEAGVRVEVGTAYRHSTWQERDGGARLLDEQGGLHGLSIGARRHFERNGRRGSLAVQASIWRGQRDYDGRTSRGQAIETTTAVRESHAQFEADLALSDALAVTASLAPAQVQRELRDTAQASGYPETWRWTLAMAGLRWTPRSALGDLALHAAWGRPLDARMTVWLPDRDRTRLRPAAGHAWQVAVEWRHPLSSSPTRQRWLTLAGGWRRIDFGASAPAAVISRGAVVGAAAQPATRLQDHQLGVGLQARW